MSLINAADVEASIGIPKIVSGTVVGTAKQQKRKLKKSILRGINVGVTNFIEKFIRDVVAKDTGTLRAGIEAQIRTAVITALANVSASTSKFCFDIEFPGFPEYAEYHLDGTFGGTYADPTTEDTRPTTLEELAKEAEKYIYVAVIQEFKTQGYDFTAQDCRG